jgi:Domain of unknown function (DUF4178)
MPPAGRSGLGAADPRVGQTLTFEGQEWEVTDHSSYWDEGYRVLEWCCESDGAEAYLLKEIHEGAPVKWFFTRRVPNARVDGLPAAGRGATPPPALTCEGQSYHYAESTEGTYEEDPGNRVEKTTWEYWDAAHTRNLAIEVWAEGRIDCYRGAYIEPGQVTLGEGGEASDEGGSGAGAATAAGAAGLAGVALRAAGAGKAAPGRGANPFVIAMIAVPFLYIIPFFFGRPFDQCLAVALPLALLIGWLFGRSTAPGTGWIGLLGLAAVGYVFWHYAPLGTTAGLVTLLGVPLVIGLWGRKHAERGRRAVVYVAALVVGLPALAIGFYYYFSYAPPPHSLAQLGLALGPAAIGAVAAMILARLLLTGVESSSR